MALRRGGTKTAASSRRGQALGAKGEEAAKGRGKDWLSIPDGETAVLRVLPETFEEVYVHRTPIEVDQGKKTVTKHYDVPCLDQDEDGVPCPGCADEVERRYKFYVWVIVRDVEEEGSRKSSDKLMVWSGGVKLFKKLNMKHKSKGLQNRDIEVSRSGERFETEYEVEWATEKNEPMSTNDKALAKKVKSLDFYTTAPEYDKFYEPPGQRGKEDQDSNGDVGAKSLRRGSPLARGKTGTTSRRKIASSTKKTGLAKLKEDKAKAARKTTRSSKSTTKKRVIRRPSR